MGPGFAKPLANIVLRRGCTDTGVYPYTIPNMMVNRAWGEAVMGGVWC